MQRFFRTTVNIMLSAILCLQPMAYADQNLPDIGTTAAGTLTIDKELEYGDAYMRILRASSPIIRLGSIFWLHNDQLFYSGASRSRRNP